jgi:hypothetical protein
VGGAQNRLPLPALLRDPLAVLTPELKPETVARLLPLSIPLNLSPDQLYVAAIRAAVASGVGGLAAAQPLLRKVRDLPLAIATAEQATQAWPPTHPDHLAALRAATALAATWHAHVTALATGATPDGAAAAIALPMVTGDDARAYAGA